jgi:hypothetical protein
MGAVLRIEEDSDPVACGRKDGGSPAGITLSNPNLTDQVQMFKSLKVVVQPSGGKLRMERQFSD